MSYTYTCIDDALRINLYVWGRPKGKNYSNLNINELHTNIDRFPKVYLDIWYGSNWLASSEP